MTDLAALNREIGELQDKLSRAPWPERPIWRGRIQAVEAVRDAMVRREQEEKEQQ
jgi:hypothetical protein